MKLPVFDYTAPSSLAAAVRALSSTEGAKALAGGQSLIPLMAFRLAVPSLIVDLTRLENLRKINIDGEGRAVVGALANHSTIGESAVLARQCPMLGDVVSHIGHLQIRNRGTIGGSLAHADPTAEWPAFALLVDAQVDVAGVNGERTVMARELISGPYEVNMDDAELITCIRWPSYLGWHGGVSEVCRRAGDFALAGSMVLLKLEERRVVDLRVVIMGVAPTPIRLLDLEATGRGRSVDELPGIIGASIAKIDNVTGDIHASPSFRIRLARVCVIRAVGNAVKSCSNGSQEGISA